MQFCAASALILVLVSMEGCGLKANPVPRGLILPPMVNDLAVSATPAGNLLMWTMPVITDKRLEIATIRIFKSELLIAGESCPGCPREFRLAAEPTPRNLVKGKEDRRSEYVDTGVKPGLLYTYTIRLCDSSGFCGPESNKAEVKYRGDLKKVEKENQR